VTNTATASGELGPLLGYDADQAAQFAAVRLPPWTRNDPASLVLR